MVTIRPEQEKRSEENWFRRDEVTKALKLALEDTRRMLHCCPNCWHWIEANEECELAHARPPAKVIAFGCEKFSEQIPF